MEMSKLKNATSIDRRTRQRVLDRDGKCCILCGKPYQLELAHIVSRSQCGTGTPQNLVCLCRDCHYAYDNGGKRDEYGQMIRDYIKGWYPNWTEESVKYDKYDWAKKW